MLDMTRLLPGPMCTLYLADLGADVIKVEDAGAGDYARGVAIRPAANAGATTAWFRALNRNKRSLAVDLKSPEGHRAFMTLARGADVIVEGFRPGVVSALRVDYDAVRATNPRIVYCALSGYGQTGPRRSAAGHDVNYLGYAGVLEYTGQRGGAPALANLQIADLLGGAATAAIGILAALFGAHRSGHGRFVDVAMADAVLAHQIFALGALEDTGVVAARGDDLLTGGVPCYGVYETRDGRWLAVGALEAKFWRALCETLGRPDLVAFQLATGVEGARVRADVQKIFRGDTLAGWCERFARRRLLRVAGADVRRSARRSAVRCSRDGRARTGRRASICTAVQARAAVVCRDPRRSDAGRAHARDPARSRLCGRRDRSTAQRGRRQDRFVVRAAADGSSATRAYSGSS